MRPWLIIIAIATLAQLTGSACFKFSITRDLNNSEELEISKWIHVEVITVDPFVEVTFDIPLTLPHSDAFIFFANDDKNILQVSLNETIQGKFYEAPYKPRNEMKGGEVQRRENGKFIRISGNVPQEWLPKNYNKANAALVSADGQYYNYYKLQNFEISLPDLLVLEEYKRI